MEQKTIYCLGDSNTFGYDPRGMLGGRYPAADRWVDRLNASGRWRLINGGQNGQQIPHTPASLDLTRRLLRTCPPLDGVCILLGSNDLLCGALPEQAAARMEALTGAVLPFAGRVLVLAPPPFQPGAWIEDDRLIDRSVRLAGCFQSLAAARGLAFADTGAWELPLAFDGVHFTPEAHRRFALRAAELFAQVFP